MLKDDNQFDFWVWFREKVMPTGIMALVFGTAGTYIQVIRLGDSYETTRSDVSALKAAQAQYVTRAELLEIMKRVEQQQEIMMLRDKVGVAK